jgi:hypothetical protein
VHDDSPMNPKNGQYSQVFIEYRTENVKTVNMGAIYGYCVTLRVNLSLFGEKKL